MKNSRRVDDIPEEYLVCRDLLHAWVARDVRVVTNSTTRRKEIHRTLRCSRCRTIRTDMLSMQGLRLRSSYSNHPEGYLLQGTGQLDADERGKLRLRHLGL